MTFGIRLKRVCSLIPSIMKGKSDSHPDLFKPRLLIGLLVLLAGALLVAFGSGAFANAITQHRGKKSAPNVTQARNVKPSNEQPDQGFWAQTDGPQGGDGIALATSPNGHVFVGTQGGGVFRSTDNGGTWTGVNDGMTDTNVRALAINSASDIFAGTFSGVFRSTDNGDSWTPVNNGLEFPSVISLAINSSGDIFAGT